MVDWENGEITTETKQVVASGDPIPYAIYAK